MKRLLAAVAIGLVGISGANAMADDFEVAGHWDCGFEGQIRRKCRWIPGGKCEGPCAEQWAARVAVGYGPLPEEAAKRRREAAIRYRGTLQALMIWKDCWEASMISVLR